MRKVVTFACVLSILASEAGFAQSLFNGTWRPDPQSADPGAKHDLLVLAKGIYACKSCAPPYQIKADGQDQSVAGNEDYDTVNIKIVDERTIVKTVKKKGEVVFASRLTASSDGTHLTETQTIVGVVPKPVDFASNLLRVSAGPPGSHKISGEWRLIDSDLVNHEEDTKYMVMGKTLTMTDHLGRSFAASFNGVDAPYKGDPSYTSVSLKLIDDRTIEESDKKDGKVVQINRWSVDPDGTTIHARFDNTQGMVQEQTGHKLH